MKSLFYISILATIGSCATKSHKEKIQDIKDGIVIESPTQAFNYAATISTEELKTHVYNFSATEMEGRAVGTKGQKRAAKYLLDYYVNEEISPPPGEDDYFQEIPQSYLGSNFNGSENVLAYVKGSSLAHEIIVVSAHYDHEGIKEGQLYPGADDNSSGTAALLEIAQAFELAKKAGHGPKRSILFIHFTAEEIGLHGSRYYSENPTLPLSQTVVNLNVDMIGRVDNRNLKVNNDNYIYLIGSDRLSTELHYISEAVNKTFAQLDLQYRYNAKDDHNLYYFRSDHYNFAKESIPVIFYFNGEHDDYHKPTDTADKINFQLLQKRAQLIFSTAWQLANQPERIVIDKIQ